MFPSDGTDPCEVQFTEFDLATETHLPRTWIIRHGDQEFARLKILQWEHGNEPDKPAVEPDKIEEK